MSRDPWETPKGRRLKYVYINGVRSLVADIHGMAVMLADEPPYVEVYLRSDNTVHTTTIPKEVEALRKVSEYE
jgi:hypothetical protein